MQEADIPELSPDEFEAYKLLLDSSDVALYSASEVFEGELEPFFDLL